MPRTRDGSEAVEDYAKEIFSLQQRTDGGAVTTTALARRLGVAPSSVTAMVKRMDEMRLVRYEPYRGVRLTSRGERLALEVIRHHRLLEAFLADAFDMPWDRVHDEAEVLEHYISEELEELIASKLGDPEHDPHGDPIPNRDLAIADEHLVPLAGMQPGERGVFARVSDSEAGMLRYLADRGIYPGVELIVRGREPFGGPITIEVSGAEHLLGGELVERMRVALARSEGAGDA
jgi:DtxR family Mn-dependent transcriptional regulator